MSDSLKTAIGKALTHHRARPWLAVAAELPATSAAHHYWGDSPIAAVGLTLGAGVLTVSAWWAGHGTTPHRRIHATLSTGAATGYFVAATLTDPLSFGMVSTLAIGGAVAAGGWNIRQALRVNPDTKQIEKAAAGQSQTGVLVKAIGEAKVALRGTPKVEPNKVTAPLQLSGGQVTTDELGNRIKHIAGELGVSPTSIRIQPDPDRGDHATLIVVPQDMLKQTTPWPGPKNLGGSITEPIEIGLYEDGQPAILWFPAGPGRNATHFLTAGMNGSGKSAGQSVAITEALTRRDVVVWAIDPSKGMQTFAPFLGYLDWCEMTMSGGEAMIDALTMVINARADEMGRHGFKNWTPEVFEKLGMPYMVVWIEEAAKFFRNGTEMEGLVMEARSAGISVIISLQRPSSTSMPTDVREQLGGALCFGVKGSTTADMALPDDVRDAGARPEAWENRRPGYAYLVAPGVDEDRYATPLRTYFISDEDIAAALAIAPRPSLDPVTAAAAGDAYANRTHYTPDTALTGGDTQPTETIVMTKDQAVAAEEELIERQVGREIDATLGDADDDNDIPDVDADREITRDADAPVWQFGQPRTEEQQREKTPAAALAELHQMLEEWRDQGREQIGPRDFQPYGPAGRLCRSRAWVSGALGDLADEGIHLAETDQPGVYKLLHPEYATA